MSEGGASGEASSSAATGEFVAVLRLDELPPGAKRAFDLAGRSVLVCNAGGELFAVDNACTHAGVPLLTGRLRACVLECPLHGGKFDLHDGRPVAGPPRRALACHEVRVDEGWVAVRVARQD